MIEVLLITSDTPLVAGEFQVPTRSEFGVWYSWLSIDHLAYTPAYDSFAPGLSIVIGWFPPVAYSGFWWGAIAALQYLRGNHEPFGTHVASQALKDDDLG